MELPFEKTVCRQYQQKVYHIENLEQTQEIKLPETMPDIGSIITCWGQVILRGKDWKTGGAGFNGGVMVWLIYQPEDGSAAQQMESWIPWKTAVDLQTDGEDGIIRLECFLRNIDARNTSGRKIIVRTGISILTQILIPKQLEVYKPDALPEDVEQLNQTYPLTVIKECGEKSFLLEEEFDLMPAMDKDNLIYYHLYPEVREQKVMGSKMVFRGVGQLHLLYRDAQQNYYTKDYEIPFAQYAELDGAYESTADASNLLCITSMELEINDDSRIKLKAGLVSQYTIQDVELLTVLQDAYSPCRDLQLECQEITIPAWVEQIQQTQECSAESEPFSGEILDLSYIPETLTVENRLDLEEITETGSFHILLQDDSGRLSERKIRGTVSEQRQSSCQSVCFPCVRDKPVCRKSGDRWRFETQTVWDLKSLCSHPIKMVHSVEVGDLHEPDPERPSVIVRARHSGESLWDMAKGCGTTVGAIRKLNHLDGEPEENQLLLIPII